MRFKPLGFKPLGMPAYLDDGSPTPTPLDVGRIKTTVFIGEIRTVASNQEVRTVE